jgi:hypothetical protein
LPTSTDTQLTVNESGYVAILSQENGTHFYGVGEPMIPGSPFVAAAATETGMLVNASKSNPDAAGVDITPFIDRRLTEPLDSGRYLGQKTLLANEVNDAMRAKEQEIGKAVPDDALRPSLKDRPMDSKQTVTEGTIAAIQKSVDDDLVKQNEAAGFMTGKHAIEALNPDVKDNDFQSSFSTLKAQEQNNNEPKISPPESIPSTEQPAQQLGPTRTLNPDQAQNPSANDQQIASNVITPGDKRSLGGVDPLPSSFTRIPAQEMPAAKQEPTPDSLVVQNQPKADPSVAQSNSPFAGLDLSGVNTKILANDDKQKVDMADSGQLSLAAANRTVERQQDGAALGA